MPRLTRSTHCPKAATATRVVSLVPGLGRSNVDLTSVSDPHTLADLDLAILPGEFGVAENAAVWIDGRKLPHRVVFVITNHLVLVVHARDIVSHMHGAYVGAPGARTCSVVVVG